MVKGRVYLWLIISLGVHEYLQLSPSFVCEMKIPLYVFCLYDRPRCLPVGLSLLIPQEMHQVWELFQLHLCHSRGEPKTIVVYIDEREIEYFFPSILFPNFTD